jgi:hypothetical protein
MQQSYFHIKIRAQYTLGAHVDECVLHSLHRSTSRDVAHKGDAQKRSCSTRDLQVCAFQVRNPPSCVQANNKAPIPAQRIRYVTRLMDCKICDGTCWKKHLYEAWLHFSITNRREKGKNNKQNNKFRWLDCAVAHAVKQATSQRHTCSTLTD